MPIPISEALDDTAAAATSKAAAVGDVPRYLASSALAGVYVGLAIVLLVSVSAPLVANGSGAARLVQGAVFGLALTLVIFAGAELFTGNVMFMLHGWWRGVTGPQRVAAVAVASLAGNLAGSLLLAVIVHAGGTLSGRLPSSSPRSSRRRTPPADRSCSGERCCATPSCAWPCGWPPAPVRTAPSSPWCGGRCWRSSGLASSIRSPTPRRSRSPPSTVRSAGRRSGATCYGRCPATSSAGASWSVSATPGSAAGGPAGRCGDGTRRRRSASPSRRRRPRCCRLTTLRKPPRNTASPQWAR